jgi:hypothetical protein
MKTQIFKTVLPLLAVALLAVACTKEENGNPPVGNTDSDFMLVKNSLGKTLREAESVALGKGYIKSTDEYWLYTINENGNTKRLLLYTNTFDSEEILKNVEMTMHTTDLNVLKMYFRKWVGELQQNLQLTTVPRKEYVIEYDEDNDREYSTIDALLSDIDRLTSVGEDFRAVVGCVDQQSFTYEITLYSDMVSLQVINDRVDAGNDTIPIIDDILGKDRDILLMRVDYLTYKYLGYTTFNIRDKISGDTIPFFSVYRAPTDFGYQKLYYRTVDSANMLFHGDIIWMGCGMMQYPQPSSFVTGPSNNLNLPYPGQSRISHYNGTRHTTVTDETNLRNIWNTISIQSEFQYFYSRTTKKVAVYLYTPSVGCGNPADWYYLVFVEQQ